MKNLKDPTRPVTESLERLKPLQSKLGPVLFQLPPRRLAYYLPGTRGMRESVKASYTREELRALLAAAGVTTFTVQRSFPYITVRADKT
jgi:hypothetical protein